MSVSDSIRAVRRFYAAGPADEDGQRYPFVAPDLVWHVPGDNPVSGRYHGVAEVFEAMVARMQPLDEWDISVGDVMGNDDLVVATVHLTGRRGQVRVDSAGAHVFRFDGSGAITEAWGFVVDQPMLDKLFSA